MTWKSEIDPATEMQEIFFDNGDTLPARFSVDFRHIKVGEKIGEGNWSVHKAGWLGRKVAVKKFNWRNTFYNINFMSREVNRMLNLRHPNILKLLGFYLSAQDGLVLQCSMIKELMDCDLEEYIEKGPLSDDQVVYIISEVARGMNHVHKKGCFHRDLKPKNVLMRKSEVTGFNVDVKIADFGSSDLMGDGRCDQTAGTIGYKAPEQFDPKAKLLLDKVDVFGFGVLCFKILTGKRAYESKVNVRGVVEKISREEFSKRKLPEGVIEVIWTCLDTNPEVRPDFEKISIILDRALREIREKMPRPLALSTSTSLHLKESMLKGSHGYDHFESILHNLRLPKQYKDYFIPSEELFVIGLLRMGSSGIIYKVEWKGILCAQKIYGYTIPDELYLPDIRSTVEFLLKVLPKLCHKNIVTFMGYSITSDNRLSIISINFGKLLD